MACEGCEVIPRLGETAARLYLAPKLAHTRGRALRQLRDAGWEVTRLEGGVLYVDVPEGGIPGLLESLAGMLTRPELGNCPAVVLTAGAQFEVRHLGGMVPLSVLVARQEDGWLGELLAEERLEMHFQPILHADDGERVFAYEALARGIGADGSLIRPDRLFGAARATELMFHLDRAARVAAIRQAAAHGITENVFINFNPTSVYDPVFCLKTTFDEVNRLNTDPGRYVFEVVETDEVEDAGHLEAILREYRRQGFRVALDDLGAGYGSLDLLQNIRPDFVKLDRAMVDGVAADGYRASITGRLIQMAKDLEVTVIAEGVERVEDWIWLREREVDLVQGFHFARPARTPPRPGAAGFGESLGAQSSRRG
ncbi:EAL domain-containing protein [Spiribacter halobius]|uniref:EAL domain-containing protein n=1 Tax=Sediminicurvatus halobius TaxID=2182432 RepID=A0A2U2N5T6_9GAMM|nr:EAL domain-containing protein [Spiribacter halobius]PWG64354.1 EAL domain-containing protein [Spiribacter halobius]UEX79299.1 EAL domain-containing protein [Spiribacter halobius]